MKQAVVGFLLGALLLVFNPAQAENGRLRQRVAKLERQVQESNQRLGRFIWCHEHPDYEGETFEECEERIDGGIVGEPPVPPTPTP